MLHNKYFEIMKEFLNGYFKEVYGAEISKKCGLSQKNVALTLIELQKQGILSCKIRGNRKYYSINFSNLLVKDYLVLFELQKKIMFLEKHKNLIDFSREVEGEVVCVFGSYAKNSQRKNSDLDVFIVGKTDSQKMIKTGGKFGFKVQVFNLSLNDFKKSVLSKSTLVQEILDSHVILRGVDKFAEVVLNG